MKKTLNFGVLLVITMSIVSCIDVNDNPVVYAPLEQVLTETEIFSDIKENPDTAAHRPTCMPSIRR